MKIRMHRGLLSDSLETVAEVAPGIDGIRAYLKSNDVFSFAPGPTEQSSIKVIPYGFDARIGWDTHMVLVDSVPYAFTDGMVK